MQSGSEISGADGYSSTELSTSSVDKETHPPQLTDTGAEAPQQCAPTVKAQLAVLRCPGAARRLRVGGSAAKLARPLI
jgi:hypothetical protein